MNLILEKDFIDQIFILNNTDCDVTLDLYKFIQKDFSGYNLICDLESFDEYQLAASENPIFEIILDSFTSITYCTDLKNEICNESFYESLGSRNIFLTTLKEEKTKDLTKRFGYIYVSNENIKDSWVPAYNLRNGINYKVTKSLLISDNCRFDNWQKIESLCHPITSLVIFDKFLLKSISPEETQINLIPLLRNLVKNNETKIPISITIISEIKVGRSLKDYALKIQQKLEETGMNNVKVNLIRHLKALYPRSLEGLHARYIITNNAQIISDESFNYFKKDGSVRNVANISGKFIFCGYSKESYLKDIDDLKLYLFKIKNEPNGDEKYSDVYFPHKFNPLLN